MDENQSFCSNCGAATERGGSYCRNCGSAVKPEDSFCSNCGAALHLNRNTNTNTASTEKPGPEIDPGVLRSVQPRDIVKSIIFSIITCGIYSIYWFIVLTDELNILSGNENDTSGGLSYILTLITCGFYGYYWVYRMGRKVDMMNDNQNGSSGIIYLILMLLCVGIVNYALIQDAINQRVENY